MQKLFSALVCCLFILTGCSKTPPPEPIEDPNKNEIIGYISIPDRNVRLFAARGSNATQFERKVVGSNTEITIIGKDTLRTVQLTLVNISSPGTYSFQNADSSTYDGSFLSYREGPESSPSFFYSTSTTNPEILALGTFDISVISDTNIQGVLRVMLGDAGPFTTVDFDDVMFKGEFNK